MAIKHSITLSTTEPNNEVGVIKIRQADEQTQTLDVQITADGVPKSFVGYQPFFCAKLGQTDGLGIIEQKVTGVIDPEKGTLEYVMRPEDWQKVGRQTGYFAFRKMKNDHEWTEQFSTRNFAYNVIPSATGAIKEVKKDGSTYIWTLEDMLRLFDEYMATGKIDWENYKNDERTIWETYRLAEKINWDDYKLREKNEWQNYKADEKTTWEKFVEDNREFLETADPGGKIILELLGARGEAYATLGERLDSEKAEVSAQLAQTDKKVSNDQLTQNLNSGTGLSVGTKKTKRPLITFIDDDGAVGVYTRLKPIFESRGVPCTIAIVSDWADGKATTNGTTALSKEQLLELQDLGWEIASHSKTHASMQEITDEKIVDSEVVESKEKLLELGFDVKNYVRPYGQSNPVLAQATSRYYKTSVGTNAGPNDEVNNTHTNHYWLRRVALGSYAGGKDTIEHHKSVIDKAIAENGWLIFMTHVWAQPIENDQLIADVLDYAISQNVDIVNLDEGLEVFGNKLNINNNFRITADDQFISDNFVIGRKGSLIDSASKASDISFLLNNYNSGEVVYSVFTFSQATGMPQNYAGVLTTFLETTETGYVYQTYRTYGTGKLFSRTYVSKATGWSEWSEHSFEKATNKTSFIVPNFTMQAGELKTMTVDLTNILGDAYKTSEKSYVLTNRNGNAKIWSSNIIRGILNIHYYNYTQSPMTINASDWDILFI